jgi:hypothetical protein
MWHNVDSPVGVLQVINAKLGERNRQDPHFFPNFSASSALVAASDYSGEHQAGAYHVLSYVITSSDALAEWERYRQLLRSQHRLSGRRMAYAKLDKIKSRALPGFLAAFGRVESIVCCVAINKKIGCLFDPAKRIDLKEWGLESWSNWDTSTFERLLRVTHVAALLLAGLTSPWQNLIWITDEDAIASNAKQLEELIEQFTILMDRYLTRRIGHIRCGTTANDGGDLDIEDLAAVPDLVGGAFAELLTAYAARGARVSDRFTLVKPDNLAPKASQILSWAALPKSSRVLFL